MLWHAIPIAYRYTYRYTYRDTYRDTYRETYRDTYRDSRKLRPLEVTTAAFRDSRAKSCDLRSASENPAEF